MKIILILILITLSLCASSNSMDNKTFEQRLEKIEADIKELKELLMKPQPPSAKDKKRFIIQYRLAKELQKLELENKTNNTPKKT